MWPEYMWPLTQLPIVTVHQLCMTFQGLLHADQGVDQSCSRLIYDLWLALYTITKGRQSYNITTANSSRPQFYYVRISNWTEWSTIQGVIGRVTSKSAERAADFDCSELYKTRTNYWLILSITKFEVNSTGCTNSRKTARKNPFICTWLMRKWRRCPITGIQFEVAQIGYL